jgi:hypothetical protein
MWIRRHRRHVRRAALALAVAAIAAPGAQAYVANEGANSTTQAHSRPDDRGVRVGGPAATVQPVGAIERRTYYRPVPNVAATSDGSIGWGDVGIGASVALALAGFGVAAVRFSSRAKPATS